MKTAHTQDGALILAAGKGTRMHSALPKVLHTLLGEPILGHVNAALTPGFGDAIWTIIGHEADRIRAAYAHANMHFIEQTQQLGTGHALMTALPHLREAGLDRVLVVNGDMPLLSAEMVRRFMRDAEGADVAIATLSLPSPGAYGRVVRHNGRVTAIVEAKDFDPALHGPEPKEINVGLYLLRLDVAEKLLPRLSSANNNGEYYITDLVTMAVAERMVVTGLECGNDPTLLGVNNPMELAHSEALLRQQVVQALLESGVVVHAPEMVSVSPFAVVEPGAELHGPCEIFGTSHIAAGASVSAHCWIKNSTVAEGAIIHPFSHLDGAVVGPHCLVGPYARLRPGAVMETRSHVGNFVEMKKATLGQGAKANHLSYLGDASIGAGSNIGAGTITCNYDGVHKYRTVIGENAFIGSNTSLVAPVTIGAGALVGAGSVITKDVPDNTLVLARARQCHIEKKVR